MEKALTQLKSSIGKIFNWHKSRIDCFSKMLIALMSKQTVNLQQLATHFNGKAQIESNYRRIQYFLKQVEFDYEALAKWCYHHMIDTDKQVYLSMDRTNWKWGQSDINILMLSIVYEGISIPIYWELLPHRGNSDHAIRIKLIQRFIDTFGTEKIAGLLADREFIGKQWLAWLKENKIPFVIRVKNNLICTNKRGGRIKLSALFQNIQVGKIKKPEQQRKLFGLLLSITATRSSDGELVIVISDIDLPNALSVYSKRWEIENLFQALKGRGFHFEDTHITDPVKISKILALLCIGFCWAHKAGEYKDLKDKPIKRKKHGRLQSTYFRYGLNMICHAYEQTKRTIKPFKKCIQILSKTNFEMGLL